jgi:hypothetical protein
MPRRLSIDQLVASVLAVYQTVPPGRQAQVEQLTEDLRHSLARAGVPVTPPTGRALFVGLAIGTTIAELHPRHPNAPLATDLLAAAAQLTRARVDLGGLDDEPRWGGGSW